MCLFGTEGRWQGFVFSIISYVIYIPFCVWTKYYGELVTAVFVIIADLVILFKWEHSTHNHVVKIYD